MKILYDIRTAQTYYQRGVWRYVIDLLKGITKNANANYQIIVLYDKKLSRIELDPEIISRDRVIDIDDFNDLCKDDVFDYWIIGTMVYFSCPKGEYVDYTYPKNIYKKCKKVAAIVHDFIPIYYQKDCLKTQMDKVNYALQFETLKIADYYICNSEYTKSKVEELLNATPMDCLCIYGGADFDKWINLNSKSYDWEKRDTSIVSVIAPFKRKNYDKLAEGFCMAYNAKSIPKTSKLYLICEKTRLVENEIKYLTSKYKIPEKQIVLTSFISDEEMIKLISNSKATMMPSFYEGLGLPILESYVAGTPAFAANTTSTVEFVSAESSFSPNSIDEIKDTIIKIFNDKDFCIQSFNFGQDLIKRVNWNNASTLLLDFLSKNSKNSEMKTLENL